MELSKWRSSVSVAVTGAPGTSRLSGLGIAVRKSTQNADASVEVELTDLELPGGVDPPPLPLTPSVPKSANAVADAPAVEPSLPLAPPLTDAEDGALALGGGNSWC